MQHSSQQSLNYFLIKHFIYYGTTVLLHYLHMSKMTKSSGQKKPKSTRNPTRMSCLRRKLTLKHALSPVLRTSNIKLQDANEPEETRQEMHDVNNSDQ